MAFANPDRTTTILPRLVSLSEAVLATPFPLPLGEADRGTHPRAGPRITESSKGAAQIDSGLLEHLGGHLVPPGKPCHSLRDRTIAGHGESAAGGFTVLPLIELLDQIEA
jgi:hypothetical protein